jgi:hypothetical protein
MALHSTRRTWFVLDDIGMRCGWARALAMAVHSTRTRFMMSNMVDTCIHSARLGDK